MLYEGKKTLVSREYLPMLTPRVDKPLLRILCAFLLSKIASVGGIQRALE